MKTKKKLSFYIFVSLIFCIIYVIFAAYPLSTEYQFVPEWKIDVSNPTVKPIEEKDELLYFKLGQSMGYFTLSGKVTSFITYPYKSSISEKLYTYYGSGSTSAVLYNFKGEKAGIIYGSGFPMIDNDRIFVFLPGGSSFITCTETGDKKWEYGGTVPITAFDSSKEGCVAGFADGSICNFDKEGNILQRFTPGGSDYPVILGAAVSSNGKYIAAVSGQKRQRFILARADKEQTKIIFHEFLNSDDPIQKLVKFSNDDSTVYYNSKGTLGIIDVKTGRAVHFKISGQAISIKEAAGCTFILTKLKDKYTVYAVEHFATLMGNFSFNARNAFIQTHGNKLYVGKDFSISCISVRKK